MKYGMMPRVMWLLFHGSFEKALETELHQKNGKEIMRKAHKRYKEILTDVDEFDPRDRFLVNILSCAMFSGVYLSLHIPQNGIFHNGASQIRILD